MNYYKILSIVVFSLTITLYSCNDKANTPKQDTIKTIRDSSNQGYDFKTEADRSPQNAGGVWHYTCSKGCTGGAGLAVNCETCGSLLAHNSAYHSKPNSTPTSSAPFANPPAAQPEPSQNSAGVWHYTCRSGCTGGSGSAGSCTTCGNALAHNTAYH